MTFEERRHIITTASKKMFADFLWLKKHTKTPYVSSEFVINEKYSIFAFEEFDEEDVEDRWITITLEKYNERGRCVNDFVVTAIAYKMSKQAISVAISNLFTAFENKTHNLDELKLKATYEELDEEEKEKGMTRKTLTRIHWLFDNTDFTESQIANIMDLDVGTINIMRKEWNGCAV